jgi:hypothetical protein
VLQVRVAGLPILSWSRSSKHFLPHSLSSLKLPLFAASVHSFDACSQRWLWRYHTRSVQCFAAAVLASCSLAHPACFRKALRVVKWDSDVLSEDLYKINKSKSIYEQIYAKLHTGTPGKVWKCVAMAWFCVL